MSKTIYHYDRDTGEFCSVGDADQDPLDLGNWLIPANATDIQPPVAVDGMRRIFNGVSWGYEGIPVRPVEAVRAEILASIKSERDRRSEAGCQVAGNWFHNDLKSRTQWERMANRATTLEDADPYLVDSEQVAWKTMSGAFVPLTAGLIRQVVDAFEVQEVVTFKAAEIHRTAMEASTDPASYDFSEGWPKVFGE